MKNKIYIIVVIAALAGLLFQSCSVMVEPYYTNVKKLYTVEPGQNVQKINELLGIGPYDFYYNFSEGTIVYVYKYKHLYHKMNIVLNQPDTRNEMFLNTGGVDYYREPANIYMTFDQNTGKLIGYHTDAGRENSTYVMRHENSLREINRDYKLYEKLYVPQRKKKSGFLTK
ncbi:MAG: hypothetical protein ABIJ97_17325 [Bacteroidota bacterium]